jgi:hypothetical protein
MAQSKKIFYQILFSFFLIFYKRIRIFYINEIFINLFYINYFFIYFDDIDIIMPFLMVSFFHGLNL